MAVVTDVVADMLTRIRNANQMRYEKVVVPSSSVKVEIARILKEEGISEVHYIGNLEKKLDFIPGFVTTPWMISGMGIIYGKK